MARNEEKAQSMLYRFRKANMPDDFKVEFGKRMKGLVGPVDLKKTLPETVKDIPTARKARKQLLGDIGHRMGAMQDPTLTDTELRARNKELNDLISLYSRWELRLVTLGYDPRARFEDEYLEEDLLDLPSAGTKKGVDLGKHLILTDPQKSSFQFFGRAKELPEALVDAPDDNFMISEKDVDDLKGTKGDRIDEDYYGATEEENQKLEDAETKAEDSLENIDSFTDWCAETSGLPINLPVPMPSHKNLKSYADCDLIKKYTIPTKEELESFMIIQRKDFLMKKYLSSMEKDN